MLNRSAEYGEDPSKDQSPSFVTIISGLMTFSTGIFLTLVRMYEPLFRVLILQLLHQFFGSIYEPKLQDNMTIEELKA